MKRRSLLFLGLCFVLTFGSAARAAPPSANTFSRRYVLIFANLSHRGESERVLGIVRRAAAAGYNGIVLGPRAGEYIDLYKTPASANYAAAFANLREETDRLHMVLIPYAINPNEVGYAAPELMEAIPCRDTPFVVHQGVAQVSPDTKELIQNPGFETHDGDSPDVWGCDKPGVITFIDDQVKHGGMCSLRIQNPGAGDPINGHGRLWQSVRVAPFAAYEFSVWLKTKDLSDTDRLQFYFEGSDGGQPLVYANREAGFGGAVKTTQDWTKYTVRFNSASNTKLNLFFGIWSDTARGTLWFDDVEMHELGLCQTVRRKSLPLTVVSEDGTQTYQEGRDYSVGDQRLTVPAGSRIADEEHLKVFWYQRADMIGPPFANASHPEYFQVERDIAQGLDDLFVHPPGFMMTFDEWRIANWDPAGGNVTAGKYVADTVRQSIQMLKTINPRYELFVWSDMFDPNENALDKYFMANGSLAGSWDGLSKETVVMTWDGGEKALKFFSDLGMKQMIGGYYDSLGNVTEWLGYLKKAEANGATGIEGFMYTTWNNNFADIEKVAAMLKADGRWKDAADAAR